MNKALRITLIVIGVLTIASGLVFAGIRIGHTIGYNFDWPQSVYRRMNAGGYPDDGYRSGMMGIGNGMMGGRSNGPGRMGGFSYTEPSVKTLTVDQAYQAARTYLATLNNPDLKIAEVMVFDNSAYVRVVEQSTGIGAFELLVDPTTLAVFPEYGPNMMWNLKYAGLNHQSMMGGRGGRMGNSTLSATPDQVSASMPVTSAQALQTAQQYLDKVLPGTKTAADTDPFYGYYTIDILRNGNIIGMLSINGYNGQVFQHTWHGTFIATQDY